MTKPQPSNMVRFAPTTSILPNNTEENATSNRNFAVEEDESEKERFPVTPHPFKERPQNENLLSSDNTYDCVSHVSSPEITDAAQDNGEEEHGSKEDDHDEWARFAESANPGSTPNLEAYLDAKSKKENSKEQFSATLEECVVGLNQTMIHEMLQDSVVSLHEDFGKRFEAYETDIIATMKSNHNRRTALLKAMDEANRTWNVQYKNIRATILAEETTASNSDVVMESADAEGKMRLEDRKDQPLLSGEPDWEELEEFQPTRENIRHFLEARERFQNAEEALRQTLDEVHEGLKAEAEAIVQVIVDFHDEHESSCLALEDDIQHYMVQNSKRRASLQTMLEESAKQAQGRFANLLSRLSKKPCV